MSNFPSLQAEPMIAMLRRIAQSKKAVEKCDLCNIPIGSRHRHLLELDKRQVVCSCEACAFRFQDVAGGRFKLIPRDIRLLTNFQMSDAQWDAFNLPINLTFFYRDSRAGKMVAMYPSPAGATESLLPAGNWQSLEMDNSGLAKLEADVEALLVHRVGTARDYYITPIDVCYELVGLIRSHWRGLSGGEKVWEELEKYFAGLKTKAEPWEATSA